MIEISNSFMKAGFDDSGRLAYLENLKEGNGNIIECPAAIFRMVMKEGDNWEITASSGDQDISVEKRGDRVFICADGLRVKDHRLDIRVTLTASLTDSHLIFSADVVNLSDATIVDFMFPRIGTIKSLAGGKPMLYWPKSSGEVITDIGGKLARMGSPYDEYNMLSMSYPSPASMQWMALADGDQLLYFGSHDSDFYACALRVIGKNSDPGSVIMDFSKHVFVKPQERWQGKQFVLSLFKGTWRHGADIYRAWAEEWFPAPRKPEWVQNMLGYFLVINKQQYGDVMWPYDTLPELWEYAAAHGCDTLGLFGWYAAGHDNQYPYLSPGEDMGGLQKLIDNIRKVREKGGRVTLYCQGHLIDITTEYYKKEGVKVEARSLWGTPYFEQYNKYHESEYLKNYTKKTFSTACPSCPEWHELMCENARQLYSYGPDGILMDQIGGMPPYPCFNESHPHAEGKPSLSFTRGRMKLIDLVHEQTKRLDPEFGFIIEHVTDLYSSRSDCIHGVVNCRPAPAGARKAVLEGKDAGTVPFPELFRYTFPEVIITIRNTYPYITPEFANFAFAYGYRYEMELRYEGDVEAVREDRYKEWREYACKVTGLRRKYSEILIRGKFADEEGFVNEDSKVAAKAFISGEQMGIALWNDSGSEGKVGIEAPGYVFTEAATIDEKTAVMPRVINPGQIILLVYSKEAES